MELVIHGAPRTKKTSNQAAIRRARPRKGSGLVGGEPCPRCGLRLRAIVFPSKAWTAWARDALMTGPWNDERQAYSPLPRLPLPPAPVHVKATIYREARVGDYQGFIQGLADLLEKRRVLEDDKLIAHWDGTRLAVDRRRPRIELTILPYVEDGAQVPLALSAVVSPAQE